MRRVDHRHQHQFSIHWNGFRKSIGLVWDPEEIHGPKHLTRPRPPRSVEPWVQCLPTYQTDAISSCCLRTFFIAASRALSMTRRPLNLKTLASLELQMKPNGPPAWCSNIGHKGWSLSATSSKTPLGGLLRLLLFQDALDQFQFRRLNNKVNRTCITLGF